MSSVTPGHRMSRKALRERRRASDDRRVTAPSSLVPALGGATAPPRAPADRTGSGGRPEQDDEPRRPRSGTERRLARPVVGVVALAAVVAFGAGTGPLAEVAYLIVVAGAALLAHLGARQSPHRRLA